MRVLLIAPPWLDIYGDYKEASKLGCISSPLGLAYLGAAVQEKGGQVKVVDMETEGVNIHDLLPIISEFDPDLIGITATTPVYTNTKALAAEIKQARPHTPLVLGGVHSTVVGREALEECEYFDFQVVGEGEETIQEVMEALEQGRSLAGILGVIYRDNGAIVENPRRPLEMTADHLPVPDRNLLPTDKYVHSLPGKGFIRYATLFTSRGCPFHCIFCSQHTMHGRKMRWHSLERVMVELDQIVNQLGVEHIIIMDETLTLDRERTLELCRRIKEAGLKFTWEGWTRAETIDEELLTEMKSAGLIRLSFGIESGDAEMLKIIKKGITLEGVRRAYRIADKVGLETRGSAILGHPYETRETAWRTIKFCRSIKECQQLYLNVATPYPGTELYDYAVNGRGGMTLLTRDYSQYKRYGDPVIEVNDLSSNRLKMMQSIGLICFYFTPRRILYNVFQRAGLKAGMINSWAFAMSTMRGFLKALKSILKPKSPRPAIGSGPDSVSKTKTAER